MLLLLLTNTILTDNKAQFCHLILEYDYFCTKGIVQLFPNLFYMYPCYNEGEIKLNAVYQNAYKNRYLARS